MSENKNLKIVETTQTSAANENGNIFEEIAGSFDSINPALGGFEELAAILSLPDENFSVFAPIFLDELQKSCNNLSDKLILVQALNAAGIKLEDMEENYRIILAEIDSQMQGNLPQNKRDFLKKMISIIFNAIAETNGIAKKIIQIPIQKIHPDAKIPAYAHPGDAAVDLYATEEIALQPGEQKIIPTGLKVEIPYGYALLIQPRSGLSAKTKLRICNTPGLIDSGYRGEIGVICENTANRIEDVTYDFDENGRPVITSILHGAPIVIGKGERFAQMRLVEVPTAAFYEVEQVSESERGEGGFGSSGVK